MKLESRRLCMIVFLVVAATGCFNPFRPRIASDRGISEPPPLPDSPRNVLKLFEWCWEHQAVAEYREIFTEDFRFAFATTDSSGRAYLERGFTRDDELASATNLFLGGDASQPRANRITLEFDQDLIAFPDSRPGKTDPWHKEILTRVDLTIDLDDTQTRVRGSARFFVVRGDSALIPDELQQRGFGPDPNRWYIERYEEESTGALVIRSDPRRQAGAAPNAGSAPMKSAGESLPSSSPRGAPGLEPRGKTPLDPERVVTWGLIKVAYR